MAAELDIAAFKRVPFDDDVAIIGEELTGATFSMHIRAHLGDTATALVSLGNASPPSQGISVTYNPAYQWQEGAELLTAPASLIRIRIDEATLEALALGTPYDEPVELYYDLHTTPVGGTKRVQFGGKFILYPGVTI